MSYGREEDRYYRRELASLRDSLDGLVDELAGLREELRHDDPIVTVSARSALAMVASTLRNAQGSIDLALTSLPAPVVTVDRRSSVANGRG